MYDYEVVERCIDRDDKHIYGNLIMPVATEGEEPLPEKLPLIIFAHEFNCRWTRGLKYGKGLAPHGYAVYGFDFCGGHSESKSSGETWDMSVFTNAEDVATVYRAAREWPEFDPEKIIIMGGSQGGFACAIATGKWLTEVPLLVLLYPGFTMECLLFDYKDISEIENKLNTPMSDGMVVGSRYLTDLWGYKTFGDLPNYKHPVLILQGGDDEWVTPRYSRMAADAYPDAELIIYEGCGHIFQGEFYDRSVQDTVNFLKKHNF